MALRLDRIEVALNAYPFAPGAIVQPGGAGRQYCALGQLLRYAGVTPARLERTALPVVYLHFGRLLAREYGIPNQATCDLIASVADGSGSHGEEIECVLTVLRSTGAAPPDRRSATGAP